MHDEVGEGSVQDGRGIELLARNGGANYGKDAGTDDGADS